MRSRVAGGKARRPRRVLSLGEQERGCPWWHGGFGTRGKLRASAGFFFDTRMSTGDLSARAHMITNAERRGVGTGARGRGSPRLGVWSDEASSVVQGAKFTPGAVCGARVDARGRRAHCVRSVAYKACVRSRVAGGKARRPRRVLSLGEQRMWGWDAWKACGKHRKSAKVACDNFRQKCHVTRGKCAHIRARKRGVAAGRGGGAPLFLGLLCPRWEGGLS